MTLSHELLADSRLFTLLWRCDQDLAAEAQAGRCPSCDGPLHKGNYPRKPRGGPAGLGPEYKVRLSFCCSTDGCRKRRTPPSVRFLGPRFYLGAVVILVSALRDGLTERRAAELKANVGVSVRTLRRWRKWWQESFVASPFWKSVRARFMPPIDTGAVAASLVERFGNRRDDHVALLKFLSPITTKAGLAMAG
jgi:hypothetical protein